MFSPTELLLMGLRGTIESIIEHRRAAEAQQEQEDAADVAALKAKLAASRATRFRMGPFTSLLPVVAAALDAYATRRDAKRYAEDRQGASTQAAS